MCPIRKRWPPRYAAFSRSVCLASKRQPSPAADPHRLMAVPMNTSRADKKQPAALRKTAMLPRPFLPSAAALDREEAEKAATVNPMNKDKIKVEKNKQTEIMQSVY